MSAIFYPIGGPVNPPFRGGELEFSEGMSRKLEDIHVGLLMRITRNRAVRQKDRTWRKVSAATVLEKSGTQPLGAYIDRRQATLAEWVALRPILEVCDKEKAYKRGRRRQEPWWRQTAPDSS